MNHTGKNYEEMTLEELQREAWEALMDTDIIDGPLTLELEKIREALNWKRPVEYLYTPEESWAIFLEKNAEEPYVDYDDEAGEIALGDVVICTDRARQQAEEFGHSFERELVYLFVHSMFHLLGYDHMEPDEKSEMRQAEEEIMEKLDLAR